MKEAGTINNPSALSPNKLLEGIGAICGIIGAVLVAIDPAQYAAIAFPIWLISSIALAIFAYKSKLIYLLGLQLTFTAINFGGVLSNSV